MVITPVAMLLNAIETIMVDYLPSGCCGVVGVAGGADAPSLTWVVGNRRSLRSLAKSATTPSTHVKLVKLFLL